MTPVRRAMGRALPSDYAWLLPLPAAGYIYVNILDRHVVLYVGLSVSVYEQLLPLNVSNKRALFIQALVIFLFLEIILKILRE